MNTNSNELWRLAALECYYLIYFDTVCGVSPAGGRRTIRCRRQRLRPFSVRFDANAPVGLLMTILSTIPALGSAGIEGQGAF